MDRVKLKYKKSPEKQYRRKCLVALLSVIRNNCDGFMPPEKVYLKDWSDDRENKVTSTDFGFKYGESRLCYGVVKEMLYALLDIHFEKTPTAKKQTFIALGFFLYGDNAYFDVLGLEARWVRSQVNKLLNTVGLPELDVLFGEYKQCKIKI